MSKPWPKTEEDLLNILHEHENKNHYYGSVAESLVEVTLAMFNYFASKQGMTGYQASWAELQFIKRSRNLEGPFAIIDGTKLLYPQYDIESDVKNWVEEWKPIVGKIAAKKLIDSSSVHPDVLTRWKELAALVPEDEEGNDSDAG